MIWLAVAMLVVLALLPAIWTSRTGAGIGTRGRREAALALHRAQLLELERDLAECRIGAEDYRTARLEVQRRLLAAAESQEAPPTPRTSSNAVLWACLALAPFATVALYSVAGRPELSRPATPQAGPSEAQLIEQLRGVLARMDPHSPQAVQGNLLLAHVEESRGDDAAAAAAWQAALAARFDPQTAIHAAEALTRAAGTTTPDAVTLYRRALAAAPPDASWRAALEQRLAEQK